MRLSNTNEFDNVIYQDILEKFEFFPIKCRVQRVIETLQINKSQDRPCTLKTQVYYRSEKEI